MDLCIEKLRIAAGTYFRCPAMLLSFYSCLCIIGELFDESFDEFFRSNVLVFLVLLLILLLL